MPPVQAPSATGLQQPAAPTGQVPIAPSGAPNLPALPQGTTAPTTAIQQPQAFDTQGMVQAIGNYYQIPKQTSLAQAGVKQNEFNATTAFQGQQELSSKEAQLRLDAGSYKIQQGPNGVSILDPVSGQPVDIGTYVNRTGANPAQVLAKSTNPHDQQFVSDYNNFQQFMNAALQKNTNKEAENVYNSYIKANPALENITPQQASNLFLQQYGSYFGVGQPQQTPTSTQYTPQFSQNLLNYLLTRAVMYGSQPTSLPSGYSFPTFGSGVGSTSIAPPTTTGQ